MKSINYTEEPYDPPNLPNCWMEQEGMRFFGASMDYELIELAPHAPTVGPLEEFKEKNWWDMGGRTILDKKLEFALFRRGLEPNNLKNSAHNLH